MASHSQSLVEASFVRTNLYSTKAKGCGLCTVVEQCQNLQNLLLISSSGGHQIVLFKTGKLIDFIRLSAYTILWGWQTTKATSLGSIVIHISEHSLQIMHVSEQAFNV